MVKKKNVSEYTADELEVVRRPTEEQEFTLDAYRNDAVISVYISDNTMLTKFKKLMKAAPENYKLKSIQWDTKGNPTGYFFEMRADLLRFGTGKTTRVYTEEEKRAAAERLKEYRNKARNKT